MKELYKNRKTFYYFVEWGLPFLFGMILGGDVLPRFGFGINMVEWWFLMIVASAIFATIHTWFIATFLK